MRPNHHQFLAFAYVVREGSFSAAAIRLGVTQSTITQHVAKLEAQIGSPLLLRSRTGIEVTRTGQEFYDLADRLVSLDAEIGERLRGFEAMQIGHLKVIANAPQPGLRVIRDFRAAHPDVQVDFALHDWTTATRMIRDRRADVGVLTDAPKSDDWHEEPLEEVRYTAYLRHDHPLAGKTEISLSDLSTQTLILPETGSLTERVVTQALKKNHITLRHLTRMTGFPLMCEAVLQGLGIAVFLTESGMIAQDLVQVPLRELDRPHRISIVAPKDRARLRLVRAFFRTAGSLSNPV